jgi:hypothetical protein
MIFLFESVHRVMQAERELQRAAVAYELMPTPKERSAECGMCIRVEGADAATARAALAGMIAAEIDAIGGRDRR